MTRQLTIGLAVFAGATILASTATAEDVPWELGEPYVLSGRSTIQHADHSSDRSSSIAALPMEGTLLLIFESAQPDFDIYTIDFIDWTAARGEELLHIRGSGEYIVSGGPRSVHRLQMDLKFDGGPTQHFDSGLLPGGWDHPRIAITASMHSVLTYDIVVAIEAIPNLGCPYLPQPPAADSGPLLEYVGHDGPVLTAPPRVAAYANSGCIRGTAGDGYPGCGEDVLRWSVGPGTVHIIHGNAAYNCCPDDIAVSMTLQGQYIRIEETEILTMPCDCMCCYDVQATLVELPPAEYDLDYCWLDEDGASTCASVRLTIPSH